MYRIVVALFVARLAFANTPPAAPAILEPALDLQVVSGADTHMVSSPFVDEDGDHHLCSDWEITEGEDLVWSAACVKGSTKLHIHLGDGVFSGTHAGASELHPDTQFRLRVRHRDDSGDPATEWSAWTSRDFRTAAPTPIAPLRIDGALLTPTPRWTTAAGDVAVLRGASLDLQTPDEETVLHFDQMGVAVSPHSSRLIVRLRVRAGDEGYSMPESEVSFDDTGGQAHTIFLPAMTLKSGSDAYFWISANGSTHDAAATDRAPDFTRIARGAPVPWDLERGFRADVFASGFELPVSLVAIPSPGDAPDSPYLYVAELYGTVKVVTRSGEVREFAKNLLNFDPHDSIPGSGERGLGGMTIDPANGDLIVTGIYQPNPESPFIASRVLRLQSDDGGYTAARVLPVIEFPGQEAFPSHQISNVTFGPDDKLYVHVGSAISLLAQTLGTIDGKILRIDRDGSAPSDNPFYDANDGIGPTDYTFALGFRNPFGGAWRSVDQSLYEVENGPAVDRLALVVAGRNYGWDGTDESMRNFASYNWDQSVAPVQIAFIEPERFAGSGFPVEKMRSAFVTESGPTWASGPQDNGKRISEIILNPGGSLVAAPTAFAKYNGSGKATAAGLTAGPDGLFFTDLYKDFGQSSPFDAGANVIRIRWTGFADFDARFLSDSTVALTDRSDVPDDQSISWDFGDGTTSREKNPVHHFERSGTYLIRQTAGSDGTIRQARQIFAGSVVSDVVAVYYPSASAEIPAATQSGPDLSFDWTADAPPPAVPPRGFAAWFSVELTPRFSEVYTFTVDSGDHVRLILDGNVLIDAWEPNGSKEHTGSIELAAGHQYRLMVQFADDLETPPSLRVSWKSENQPELIVPHTSSESKRRAVTHQ